MAFLAEQCCLPESYEQSGLISRISAFVFKTRLVHGYQGHTPSIFKISMCFLLGCEIVKKIPYTGQLLPVIIGQKVVAYGT